MSEGHRVLETITVKPSDRKKRPGSTVVGLILLGTAILSPAQNLGLGTGSKPSAASDSTNQSQYQQGRNPGSDRQEEPAPRKSQMNKRLGLLGRKGGPFDPKVYEARGRELQGQFYEIRGNSGSPSKWPTASSSEPGFAKDNNGGRQWLFWVGVAGVAGVSAGTVGYIMMGKAHPTTPPAKVLNLSDE